MSLLLLFPSGSSGGSPIERTPSPGVSTWTLLAAVALLGAVTAAPASASSAWTANDPAGTPAGVSVTPVTATGQWAANSPNIPEGDSQASPSVATAAWSVRPTTPELGGLVSATPATPAFAWTVLAVTTVEGGAEPEPEPEPLPAIAGRRVYPPYQPYYGTPQTATPYRARSRWVVPSVGTTGFKWFALGARTEPGNSSIDAIAAVTAWTVGVVDASVGPRKSDDDAEMLLLLLKDLI